MIKILFVISNLKPCGPTSQLFYIISNLDRTKFSPIILTLSPENTESDLSKFSRISDDIFCMNYSRLKFFLFAKRFLVNFIEKYEPDLIHSQGVRADFLIAQIHSDVPWILTSRNYPYDDYPSKFGRLRGGVLAFFHICGIRKCKHVIACSSSIKKQLLDHDISSFVIPNGVPAFSHSSVSVLKGYEHPIFISVGSLIPRKNTGLIIEAFKKYKIEMQLPGSLIILGDGVDRGRLELLENDSIFFVGNVSNVNDYLFGSDFFVSASLAEGLPNTVLEALSSGCPAILSDIPPHEEIHAVCKLGSRLFSLSNGFSELLHELINAELHFGKFSRVDAKSVTERVFSASVMSKKYQKYYLDVVNGL